MTYDTYLYANLLNGRNPCKVYTYIGRWDRHLFTHTQYQTAD